MNKPTWLKKRLPKEADYENVRTLLKKSRLHTVCQEANCPNLWECFSRNTATFLIMGDRCTRNCRFCAIAHGPPSPLNPREPIRVAEAVETLQLRYVVITSVTRDDLADGGADFFARTVYEIKKRVPEILVEILVPDFQGVIEAVRTIVEVRPDAVSHNMETVARLYADVRPEAGYRRSLDLLRRVKSCDPTIYTKSGLMLGLGESDEEILETLQDLLEAGCSLLTLGQYLQPTPQHLAVQRFVSPETFDKWREIALEMGFAGAAAGPFVRSSYQARELYQAVTSIEVSI
ncbi:MAG: lipoyl synthase [Deltaproteobacteria bacterium]|nr:lipoyl synthase [Deltaproteobacteria bacterium]